MTDDEKLQGLWDVEQLIQDGKPAPDAGLLCAIVIKDVRLGFRIRMKSEPRGYGDEVYTFRLDPSQNPKVIEMTSLEDGQVSLSIYEVEGDALKLCWPSRGAPRTVPTDFAAAEGRRLFVLSRVKR